MSLASVFIAAQNVKWQGDMTHLCNSGEMALVSLIDVGGRFEDGLLCVGTDWFG